MSADELVVEPGVGDEQVDVGQRAEPGQVVVADLRVVGEQRPLRRAAAIIARLTAGLGRVGGGQPALDRAAVGAHERHVDVQVGQRPQRPVVHCGQCLAPHPAAEQQHVEVGADPRVVAMTGELTTTVSSRSAGQRLGQAGRGGARRRG